MWQEEVKEVYGRRLSDSEVVGVARGTVMSVTEVI